MNGVGWRKIHCPRQFIPSVAASIRPRDSKFIQEVHEAFEKSCRNLNGTLFVLSGAILAGLGQLAGNGAIASYARPEAILLALGNAFTSILAGATFLYWNYKVAVERRFLLTENDETWKAMVEGEITKHDIPEKVKSTIGEQVVISIVEEVKRSFLEKARKIDTKVSILLAVQFVTWLFGAIAYTFILARILI